MADSIQTNGSETKLDLSKLVPIVGEWEIGETNAVFKRFDADSAGFKLGIALSSIRASAGVFRAAVELAEIDQGCAHFVIGHSPHELSGYTVGIGGFNEAYTVSRYFLRRGSRRLFGIGKKESLKSDNRYQMEAHLRGQSLTFSVDGTQVFEYRLPDPLFGDQFGLKGYGEGGVRFSDVRVEQHRPRAFVIMQFTEPYNSLWMEVIKPVAERAGYHAFRADDVSGPGVILQDIVRGIVTSDVIIAEVTPPNQNVFYELGYAHALKKPTVLLAEQPKEGGAKLPFDISGYRCIFYDDAIRGKSKVESILERHLASIREHSQDQDAIESET